MLSRLDLEELRDDQGAVVKPLDMPFPQGAQIFRQTMSYRVERGLLDRVINNEIGSPPLTLEPDDVVTLRFRSRRGIDWTLPRWDRASSRARRSSTIYWLNSSCPSHSRRRRAGARASSYSSERLLRAKYSSYT